FSTQFRGVLVAQITVFFQGAVDDAFKFLRQVGVQADGEYRRAAQNSVEDRRRGVASKRRNAGRHLVQDHPEGEEIATGIQLFTERLLGGHVSDGAEGAARTGQ